eukprot:3766505-Amphidinium_carterae.2
MLQQHVCSQVRSIGTGRDPRWARPYDNSYKFREMMLMQKGLLSRKVGVQVFESVNKYMCSNGHRVVRSWALVQGVAHLVRSELCRTHHRKLAGALPTSRNEVGDLFVLPTHSMTQLATNCDEAFGEWRPPNANAAGNNGMHD